MLRVFSPMLRVFSPKGFDLIFTPTTRFWIRIYRISRIKQEVGFSLIYWVRSSVWFWIRIYRISRIKQEVGCSLISWVRSSVWFWIRIYRILRIKQEVGFSLIYWVRSSVWFWIRIYRISRIIFIFFITCFDVGSAIFVLILFMYPGFSERFFLFFSQVVFK
jgi:hypothetical protein